MKTKKKKSIDPSSPARYIYQLYEEKLKQFQGKVVERYEQDMNKL